MTGVVREASPKEKPATYCYKTIAQAIELHQLKFWYLVAEVRVALTDVQLMKLPSPSCSISAMSVGILYCSRVVANFGVVLGGGG